MSRWSAAVKSDRRNSAIYHLLDQTHTPSPPDEQLKQLLHDAINASLNDNGKAAYEQGTLADLIGEQARETCRKPPAHSRFLPFSIATACKQSVENALERILEGTNRNTSAPNDSDL